MSDNVVMLDNIAYLPEVKAIIQTTASRDMFKEAEEPVIVDKYKIVPWGDENNLPAEITDKAKKSEVVSANLLFNVLTGYGQGIKPMKRIIEDGKVVGFDEIIEGPVFEFFEQNDVNGFFLEQLTDLHHFYNVFPEVILSADKKKIVSLRSKEAEFSRWGVMDKKLGRITKHYYSAKWKDGAKKEDITVTDVLDRFNPLLDLTDRLAKKEVKEPRFILPVNFPTPGRTYYQWAYWWSIFESGWYDFGMMIPEFKKALLKNQMSIKYIIYISEKYFDNIWKDEGIDKTDLKKVKERKQQEYENFRNFLTGEKNAGKGMVALKRYVASGSGTTEEKYIEIEPLKTEIKGGEYIEDSEEVSNIISYAMGVHPSLIGSTPGKNKGSFSGTDKRELFQIKQALAKPFRDRLLRVLTFIKLFNKWDKDIVFAVPEFEFTTLDKDKSGKKESVNE